LALSPREHFLRYPAVRGVLAQLDRNLGELVFTWNAVSLHAPASAGATLSDWDGRLNSEVVLSKQQTELLKEWKSRSVSKYQVHLDSGIRMRCSVD
jgi:hypothetical protein